MALIKCPECGKKISDKSDECVYCGFPVADVDFSTIAKRKCEYCGRMSEGFEDECLGCGAPLPRAKTIKNNNQNTYSKVYTQSGESRKVVITETINRRYCLQCGRIIPTFEEHCPSCYKSDQKKIQEELLKERRSETPDVPLLERDKVKALLLCIFLGWCGAHKFYERRMLAGLVYLLTFGVFGYGWLLDIIILAFKPNPYYV